jgi:hypothetical protein
MRPESSLCLLPKLNMERMRDLTDRWESVEPSKKTYLCCLAILRFVLMKGMVGRFGAVSREQADGQEDGNSHHISWDTMFFEDCNALLNRNMLA